MKRQWFAVVAVVLLILTGCGRQASQDVQTEYPVIRFVQLTDTHLGQSKQHATMTGKAVEAVNQYPRPIDFVVHTGDVVDDGRYKDGLADYDRIFSTLKVPFYPIAGNNDFDLHGTRRLPQARIEECIANWKKHIGPFMEYADYPGVRIVAVSTEPLAHGLEEMGNEIYAWLEDVLADADAKKLDIILFTHTPILVNFYGGQMSSPYPDDVYETLKNTLNQYKVKAVIAGHFHAGELHYTGNVPVYVAPATTQGAYRLYEYDPNTDRLTYQSIIVR